MPQPYSPAPYSRSDRHLSENGLYILYLLSVFISFAANVKALTLVPQNFSTKILVLCSRENLFLTSYTRGAFSGVLLFDGSRGCGFELQTAFFSMAFESMAQRHFLRCCANGKHAVSLSAFPAFLWALMQLGSHQFPSSKIVIGEICRWVTL